MDINQDLATENWEDVLDERVPGRKRLLMSVFSMLVFLAAAVGFIAYHECGQKEHLAKVALILCIESLAMLLFHKILPPSPIRNPISYISKFFAISAGFSFLGYIVK